MTPGRRFSFTSPFFLLLVLMLSACSTFSSKDSVAVLPQPDANRLVAYVEGTDVDSMENLYIVCRHRLAQEAIKRGYRGFFVYDSSETVIPHVETYKDSSGVTQTRTNYTNNLKLYALLSNDPAEMESTYFVAEEALGTGEKNEERNSEMAVFGGILGLVILVFVILRG